MIERLKKLAAQLRAWMAENERAHRGATRGSCCGAPDAVYAARETAKTSGDRKK